MRKWQLTSVFIQNCASRQKAWNTRAPILAKIILDSEASFILCQELYAAQRPLLEKLLSSKYDVSAVNNGRVIFHRKNRWKPIDEPWKIALPPAGKRAVGMKFENGKKSRINIINAHLSYEISKAGNEKRLKETRHLLAYGLWHYKADQIIFGGDLNSPAGATTRRDVVGEAMNLADYYDIGLQIKPPTGRGKYHIDRAFGLNKQFKTKEVKIHNHKGSDHPGAYIKFEYRNKSK